MDIVLPNTAKKAIRLLNNSGFYAYAVGGCVRDLILGTPPEDIDIATNALPDEVKAVFSDCKTYDIGLSHGTVTVLLDGNNIEITTFRQEGAYILHRTPENVRFVKSIDEDLKRRDFTINSICCDGEKIIDPFSGTEDIKNRIIRAVGKPDERFKEDALRIMRALRFCSCLGFNIEKETEESLYKNRWLLRYVSRERIRDELLRILCGKNVEKVLLKYKEIIAVAVPEIRQMFNVYQNTPHHMYDVYTHTVKSVSNIEPDPLLRLTMLFHDVGKPSVLSTDCLGVTHFKTHPIESVKIARRALLSLRISNKELSYILSLIVEHDNRVEKSEKTMRRLLKKYDYDKDFFNDYIKVRFADTLAQSEYMREEKLNSLYELKKCGDKFLCSKLAVKQSDLEIDGNDLISLGFFGKEIGQILDEMTTAISEGRLENNNEELIEFAKSKR